VEDKKTKKKQPKNVDVQQFVQRKLRALDKQGEDARSRYDKARVVSINEEEGVQ